MNPADNKRTIAAVTVDAIEPWGRSAECVLVPTPPIILVPTPATTAAADCGGEGGAEIQTGGLENIFSIFFDSVVE